MNIEYALFLTDRLGPLLDLHMNLSKCELFSPNATIMFPSAMMVFHLLHLVIVGAQIEVYLLFASYFASKRTGAMKLLSRLGRSALLLILMQVALILLRMCGGSCKLVHLARATPPSQPRYLLRGCHCGLGLHSVSPATLQLPTLPLSFFWFW